jgi:predicted dehydrogenase
MATAGVAMAAPSDRIQVGFIGLGGQGTSRLAEFLKQPDVEAVAVCDPDTSHADRAAEIVANVQGRKPRRLP